MDNPVASFDAYAPAQIAERVEQAGITKAGAPFRKLFPLAVLAGSFIALGAAFYTNTLAGLDLGYGLNRLISALTFCLGLILVIVAGAELFTGNTLIVMAWVDGKVPLSRLLRNWGIVYAGNLAGALATAYVMSHARLWDPHSDPSGALAIKIAASKVNLPVATAFLSGIFCNALVCLAVWLCFSARTTTDRILSILFPISAFVALGFEHSVANMYFIPLGIFLSGRSDLPAAYGTGSLPDWTGFVHNLVPVTLGNIVGGGLLVAGVYGFIYLRPAKS